MTVIIRQVCATAEEVFNTLDEVEKKKKKKKKKRGGGGGGPAVGTRDLAVGMYVL